MAIRPASPAVTHGNVVVAGARLTLMGADQWSPPSCEADSIVQVCLLAACRSLHTTYTVPALSVASTTNESKVSNRRVATATGAGGFVEPRGSTDTRIRSGVFALAGTLH